jgi:hypothetical protein
VQGCAMPCGMTTDESGAYSSTACKQDQGLGWGWGHSLGWFVEVERWRVRVWSEKGVSVSFPVPQIGHSVIGDWGWVLRRELWGFAVDANDEVWRVISVTFAEGKTFRLSAIDDRNKNRVALTYEAGEQRTPSTKGRGSASRDTSTTTNCRGGPKLARSARTSGCRALLDDEAPGARGPAPRLVVESLEGRVCFGGVLSNPRGGVGERRHGYGLVAGGTALGHPVNRCVNTADESVRRDECEVELRGADRLLPDGHPLAPDCRRTWGFSVSHQDAREGHAHADSPLVRERKRLDAPYPVSVGVRRTAVNALSANVCETGRPPEFSVEVEQAKAARGSIIEPSPRSPAYPDGRRPRRRPLAGVAKGHRARWAVASRTRAPRRAGRDHARHQLDHAARTTLPNGRPSMR